MIKKLILTALCLALTFGIFAGCGRKNIKPGGTPTGSVKTEGKANQIESTGQAVDTQGTEETTNQTESDGRPDATQATNVTESTGAPQDTESPQQPEPEEDLEPLDIPTYKESVLFHTSKAFRVGKDASDYYGLSGNQYLCFQEYILGKLPTTAYRYITPDHAYAIYESDTGCRVYLFFDYVMIANNPVQKGYPILIKEMLSYSDFASLKIGDSIDAVEQVDSITSYYKDSYKAYNKIAAENLAKEGNPIRTLHYLKDGILRINYTMPEEGKLVISEIIYSEDYCLTDQLNRSVSHKIKPIDLPTA